MSITKASLIDLNGQELILDADADTSITADTDDQIDIKIAGSDSIRIKANEIENVSGAFTLDVAGNITLDSDGGVIDFSDGGTNIGRIENSSSDFKLESRVQDKDILLIGNDGGVGVTALQLDMSEAGAAIFNAGGVFNEVSADSDFRVESDNNANMFLVDAGNDRIQVANLLLGEITGSTDVIQSTSNDGLLLDVAGDIILDADSASIKLKDGGTQFGSLGSSAGLFVAGTACGIRLHSGGTKIFPTNSAGSAADGTVDLGAVGGAWKDLHLSGDVKIANGQGISFAATSDNAGMTSELLDDYEEGTWTPTIESTGSCTFATSNYTKVGRLVTVCTTISSITNTSSTNTFAMSLPFSAIGNDRATPSGFITTNVGIDLAGGYLASSSVIYFYANSTGAYRPLKHSDFSATSAIYVAFTYMSA